VSVVPMDINSGTRFDNHCFRENYTLFV